MQGQILKKLFTEGQLGMISFPREFVEVWKMKLCW